MRKLLLLLSLLLCAGSVSWGQVVYGTPWDSPSGLRSLPAGSKLILGTALASVDSSGNLIVNACTGCGSVVIGFPLTVTGGVSGAVPCFTSTTVESAGTLLALNALTVGGGAGACPTSKSWADMDSTQYVTGGGTAQAQTATLAPAATALVAGLELNFLPVAANTGAAPTLAVNGLTAKPITKLGATALVANDLTTTAIASVIYDGTEFQLQNPQTAVAGGGSAFPVTVTGGVSGAVPCFTSTTVESAGTLLAANALVIGGGVGVCPSTTTTGTGVITALGVNTGSAGAFVVIGGALGTPSSGTLTSVTGLPISTGLTGAGTGVLTALGVNVGTAGAPVVNGGALGTPSSGALTNATGLPLAGLVTIGANTQLANVTSGTAAVTAVAIPSGIHNYVAGTGYNQATAHQMAAPLACAGSASGSAATCTTFPSFTPASGDCINLTAGANNTGAFTLNVNSTSAAPVQKWMGSALASGDIVSGKTAQMCYDGTNWQLDNIGNAPSGGATAWSALTNPSGNLALTMSTNTTVFNTATAVAGAFEWANNTAAVVGTSQGSPTIGPCGTGFHASASVPVCELWSLLPGNGNDAAITVNHLISTTSTGLVTDQFSGALAAGANGTNAGALVLPGNTTAPSTTTNAATIAGPNSAGFTAYALQLSATGPAAAGVALIGAPSSAVSQVTYGLVPLTDMATQAANTVLGNFTSGTASPTATAVATCSGANNGEIYTTNTGFGCGANFAQTNQVNTGTSAMTLNMSASTTAPSVQLPAVIGGTALAGTSTGNLSTPITLTTTNSTNNNTDVGAVVGALGTSTGGIGEIVFTTGTGDIWRAYSGTSSVSAGVFTAGTLEANITAAGVMALGGATIPTMGTGDSVILTGAGTCPTLAANSADWCNLTGVSNTFNVAARSSGAVPYFQINIPTDTAQTASTESPGFVTVTGTRTWATTGTVALQRENIFAGPTYASASASQTFTDVFTVGMTPPVQGTNAIFTRGHTLGIVDSTSAASAITGAVVVAQTLGTAATSVGIGGGNINAGANITGVNVIGSTSLQSPLHEGSATNATSTYQGGQDATTTGASGTALVKGEDVTGGATATIAGGANTVRGGDNASSGGAESGGALTVRGGDASNAAGNSNVGGALTIRGGNVGSTGTTPTLGPVTITGGGVTAAATNIAGADVTIAGGLGTGNSTSAHVKLQEPTFSNTTGTAAQTQATTYVVHKKAGSTTSATATNMFNIAVAANQTIGVEVIVHVETTQATPQNCSTTENFIAAVQNTGGTVTQQSTAGTIGTICSTGSLTIAVAFSAATPSVFSVTPSWATIVPTGVIITVEVHNLSQQDITLL